MKTFFTNIRWMLMNKLTMSGWCLSFPKSGDSEFPLILSLASCLFWSFRMAWAFLLLIWSRWNNGTLAWGRRSSVTWVSSCDSRSEKRTIVECNGLTEIHVTYTRVVCIVKMPVHQSQNYQDHKFKATMDWYASSSVKFKYSHFAIIYPQERLLSPCTGLTAHTENVAAQFIEILLIKKA